MFFAEGNQPLASRFSFSCKKQTTQSWGYLHLIRGDICLANAHFARVHCDTQSKPLLRAVASNLLLSPVALWLGDHDTDNEIALQVAPL